MNATNHETTQDNQTCDDPKIAISESNTGEKMAYRHDVDLEFLGKIDSKELNDLVYCLTHDKDGSVRTTEELTAKEIYKQNYPDHNKYWELIAAEIQCFGGNTFATIFRGGKGVEYREVLMDVCDKMKVNYNKKSSTAKIEENLLLKILSDALERMSPAEIKELALATGIKNAESLTAETMVGIFQAVFRAGGFKSYQLTLIIVNAVLKALIGRGLTLAGNATLVRVMGILTGPIGWAITGVWTAVDIAGAAYRVTIPAVIQVAALRQKYLYDQQAAEVSFT